jgi:hypothetical protein
MSRPTVELDAVIDAAPSTVSDVLSDWRQNVLWEQELLAYSPATDEPFWRRHPTSLGTPAGQATYQR